MKFRPPSHWSIKAQVTLFTLLIFLASFWGLALYASGVLHSDMQRLTGEHQYSTASIIAAQVNDELVNRVNALEIIAQEVDDRLMRDPAALQRLLETKAISRFFFNGGIAVADRTGTVLADMPIANGRVGLNFSHLDYVVGVLKEGRPMIGKPVLGTFKPVPFFGIGVPIKDAKGNVIGGLSGVIDLSAPNFLDKVTQNRYGQSGGYQLISAEHRLVVTASDKRRVLAPLASGQDAMLERYLSGYEGHGIGRNEQGVEEVTAAKRIPLADWFLVAALPAQEAFAPIHEVRQRVLLATLLLTLFAGWLTWWMLRRHFQPMLSTIRNMAQLSATDQAASELPKNYQNELGELVASFNQLRSNLKTRESWLLESERQIRTIIDLSPVPTGVSDSDGNITFLNPAFTSVVGYTPADLPRLDRWWPLAYPDPAYRAQVMGVWFDRLDKARLTGQSFEPMEVSVRCKDGTDRTFLISAVMVPDSRDTKYLTVLYDITERKRAETERLQIAALRAREHSEAVESQRRSSLAALNMMEDAVAAREKVEQTAAALRESEARSRAITESAYQGIISIDEHGCIVGWNPAASRIFGYGAEEAVGQHATLLLPSRNHGRFHEAMALARASNGTNLASGVVQRTAVRKDGSEFPMEITMARWNSASAWFLTAVISDISERKAAEAQLRKLSEAMEQSPESIAITDTYASIEYVNDSFVRASGYSREELLGQNPRMLGSGHTPRATYQDMWGTLIQGKPWRGQLYNRKKNGEERIDLVSIAPLRRSDGTVSHYLSVTEDITEKKRIGDELDLHRNHLEELVELRTRELTVAREQADSASEAKTRFLANMSHEIRTPLNAIIGLTHLMKRDGVSPEQATRLDNIDKSGLHLLAIINDILDLSKIAAGKMQLDSADFHLSAVLDNVASIIGQAAQDKGLRVETDRDSVPLWLRGDVTRLRQGLLNYAGNAVKFSESGTIFLRAILLHEDGNGVLVRFEVQDQGIGIAPEQVDRLFKPFEQADPSTTRKRGGTGLGLVITRNVAELMGGQAGVDSVPGVGSTFWFTARLQRGHGVMPLKATDQATVIATEQRLQSSGARILLADDNAINREVAVEILHGVGLEVDTANDGQEALEMAQRKPYDLILMDMQMPRMDGLEATRALRAVAAWGSKPILALTANAYGEDRRACSEAGMDDFVTKPVEPQQLCQTLLKWLPEEKTALSGQPVEVPTRGEWAHRSGEVGNLNPETEQLARLERVVGMNVPRGVATLRGNSALYLRLLHQFVRSHAQDLTRLSDHLDAGEHERAHALLHALYGTAATLAADRLATLLTSLQRLLRASPSLKGDSEQLLSAMDAIHQEWQTIVEALDETADGWAKNVSDTSVGAAKVGDILDALAKLLSLGDAAAIELFETHERLICGALGPSCEILALQIRNFDLVDAHQTLARALKRSVV